MKSENVLSDYFFSKLKRVSSKWDCYFEVYERYFERFRNLPLKFMEIGVQGGGSLEMWRAYFGEKAQIIGVDISADCKQFEDENTKIYIGDQGDADFLDHLISEVGYIDCFVDDGGHTMQQQILTFEKIYPILSNGGVFICEDVHTSYFPPYGGGLKEPNSFIEYMKNKIDELNGFHVWGDGITDFTTSSWSIAFYDSMVVVEKRLRQKPKQFQVINGVVKERAE